MILEDYLRRHAELQPDTTAIAFGDKAFSYRQLYSLVAEKAESLSRAADRAIVFRATQDADFLVTYFAIHIAGKVAVPLGKDTPDRTFTDVCRMVGGAAIPEGVADILFTTGTTGRQKGVMVSHAAILADAENLIAAQGYTPHLTFIVSGPLNHIGSLSKIYPIVYLGGTLAITGGMKDLNTFFRSIEQAHGKAATFLVPASIRMLMAFGAEKLASLSDKIDFIETGAAAMAQTDMERLCRMLPHTRLYNTYASTETGIIATYNFNSGECLAGCLGRPMRHSSVVISPDGRISCLGKTLMTGYAADEELTRSVLHDGAVRTSDIGYLDAEGRLRLTGRADDVINVGGYKVAPTEIENAAMAFGGIADCVCVEAPHPVLGTVLKLLVVPAHGSRLDKRAVATFLRSRLESYKVPVLYESVATVKRTYNGKIDRKAYR